MEWKERISLKEISTTVWVSLTAVIIEKTIKIGIDG